MTTKRDYYEILGVQKAASVDEIKASYRKLAMQFHPDRNKDAGAEEKFKEISEAYAVLSDPEKRRVYDQYGHSGFDQRYSQEDIFRNANFSDFEDLFRDMGFGFESSGSPFGSVFSSMFSGGNAGAGQDLMTVVDITLAEAARGVTKTIDVEHLAECDKCSGSGGDPGSKLATCKTCGGRGRVQQTKSLGPFGRFSTVATCPHCGGRGQSFAKECSRCEGRGALRKKEKLDVRIPAGVDDGMRLRIEGMGDWGPSEPGDIYAAVRVKPDSRFERDGDDLHQEATISFPQAALGTKIKVPTLTGDAEVTVPPGTQSHTVLRLRGEGMPNIRGRGKGDMLIKIIVEIPSSLSQRQKELLIEFDGKKDKKEKGWF